MEYTITEKLVMPEAGVTYDKTVHKVTVCVYDTNGKLVATVTAI